MSRTPPLEHLIALSDDVGIVQHAAYDIPNRSTGYCTDDVARALIVALQAHEHEGLRKPALRLARTYLSFLHDAQRPDGRFRNFMSYDRRWLEEVGSEDSFGRAVWALGFGLRFAPKAEWRHLCGELVERALGSLDRVAFLRARALTGLGLAHAFAASGRGSGELAAPLRAIALSMRGAWLAARADDWEWFENEMTYDNARLPEALIRIGSVLEDREAVELGLKTLEFYASVVIENGIFVPIGNVGWYRRGGARARYGQQPLEAAALVDAGLAAYDCTGDLQYRRLAEAGLAWYYGRNSRNVAMAAGGGCFDGLELQDVNRNMGAESTLAYLASAFALGRPGSQILRIAR